MKFMMALSNNTIKAIAPNMKASTAALSTSAAKLDQAYRIEADTFGELKVKYIVISAANSRLQ